MDHLTNEDFWELMHGITGTNEWNKLNNHLQSCEHCQAEHQTLLKAEEDIRSTLELSPGFALRVASVVREAEETKLLNRPVFLVFRWTLVASILICVLCLMSLVNGVQEQWRAFVDFNVQLIPVNAPYYFLSAAMFLLIWWADRFLQPFKRFNS